MEGDRQYELRSRSRSRSETPQLISGGSSRRSSRERSNTPAEVPSGRWSSRSIAQSSRKKDKNMEPIIEQKEDTPKSNMFEGTEKSTVKKAERRSERQKNLKKQMLANGQSESESSKKKENISSSKITTSDYSSEDTDKENGPSKPQTAFQIYKQSGDWWDVFPKTDYTYSESSTCRYEIAPGILAMPNMSRRSIHSDENGSFDSTNLSTSQLIDTNTFSKESSQNWLNASLSNCDIISRNGVPQVASHVRDMQGKSVNRRFYNERTEYHTRKYNFDDNTQVYSFSRFLSYLNPLSRTKKLKSWNDDSQVDSDVDSTAYRNIRDLRFQKQSNWYQKITAIIISWIYFVSSHLKHMWDYTSNGLYLLLAQLLLVDTWLFSLVSSLRDAVPKRRKKLLFLALLPLILWIGLSQLFAIENKNIRLEPINSPISNPTIELLLRRVQLLEDTSAKQSEKLQQMLVKTTIDCVSHEELRRIKLEFQALKKSFEQSNAQDEEPQVTLTPEEIELRVKTILQEKYLSKEEWSQVLLTLASKHDFTEIKQKDTNTDCSECVTSSTSVDVKKVVREMLKIYDADKTGRVDYALESAGGQIISTRCTQRYDLKTRAFKVMGWTLFYESNNPRTVIQGHPMQPGMCWAFQDFPGYLLIKTRSLIYVTGFTLEHVPKSILPNGDMSSAPRKFNVWGLKDENDVNPVMFGEYVLENSDESLQYFPVQNTSITEPYHFVELQIHSNHGRLEYTCLYRFRIHGRLA